MKNSRRLIVIEPNHGMRELLVDYLTWLGFDVFESPHAAGAIQIAEILQQDEDAFAFLVTNSGLAQQILMQSSASPAGSVQRFIILQSPFTPRDLRRALL